MAAAVCENNEIEHEDADINDVFNSIALSEEHFSKKGFEEGFEKGILEGEVEGFHLGYHRGAEVGAEIGYYKGVAETFLLIIERKKHMPDKAVTALQKVLELINQFPTTNTEDIDIIAALSNVRAKYKKACALLKIDGTFPESDKFSF